MPRSFYIAACAVVQLTSALRLQARAEVSALREQLGAASSALESERQARQAVGAEVCAALGARDAALVEAERLRAENAGLVHSIKDLQVGGPAGRRLWKTMSNGIACTESTPCWVTLGKVGRRVSWLGIWVGGGVGIAGRGGALGQPCTTWVVCQQCVMTRRSPAASWLLRCACPLGRSQEKEASRIREMNRMHEELVGGATCTCTQRAGLGREKSLCGEPKYRVAHSNNGVSSCPVAGVCARRSSWYSSCALPCNRSICAFPAHVTKALPMLPCVGPLGCLP